MKAMPSTATTALSPRSEHGEKKAHHASTDADDYDHSKSLSPLKRNFPRSRSDADMVDADHATRTTKPSSPLPIRERHSTPRSMREEPSGRPEQYTRHTNARTTTTSSRATRDHYSARKSGESRLYSQHNQERFPAEVHRDHRHHSSHTYQHADRPSQRSQTSQQEGTASSSGQRWRGESDWQGRYREDSRTARSSRWTPWHEDRR